MAIIRVIFQKVVRCLCTNLIAQAFYKGLKLVAVDGFVVNVPDSEENRKVFGRPKNGSSHGAFPQVRTVALCEVGSHVFFSFLTKPFHCNEVTMAKHVYRDLPEKSLLFLTKGFVQPN